MTPTAVVATLQRKYQSLMPLMDERLLRRWAASEARALGWGGITAVANATGLSATTIRRGLAELDGAIATPAQASDAIRQPGGGRKALVERDPTLLRDLQRLVDPVTRGDPQSPLLWTCKSTRKLAEALVEQGHEVSHQTVARLLHAMDYSLQVNQKTLEGASHPDRDAPFRPIARQVSISTLMEPPELHLMEPVDLQCNGATRFAL